MAIATFDRMQKAANWIRKQTPCRPQIGLVSGSGLQDLALQLTDAVCLEYSRIPHFTPPIWPGHPGELWLGQYGGRAVALLRGRLHYYEGHDIDQVVFPVRALHALGVQILILTNAAGSLGPRLSPGDIMIISDHLNLMGVNPLRGEADSRLGPCFTDLSSVYDPAIQDILAKALSRMERPDKRGVYAALPGPSYETPAEVRMLHLLGADAVGMSTVPEAIAAKHLGMRVGGVSAITNLAAGLSPTPVDHRDVLALVKRMEGHVYRLLQLTIPDL